MKDERFLRTKTEDFKNNIFESFGIYQDLQNFFSSSASLFYLFIFFLLNAMNICCFMPLILCIIKQKISFLILCSCQMSNSVYPMITDMIISKITTKNY